MSPAPISPYPRFGLGTAAAGNLYRHRSDEQVRELFRAAWDAGVRYYDSAPHYGLGLSERRLGDFLREVDASQAQISTKVGRVLEPSPETIGRRDDQQFDVPASHRRRWDPSRSGVLRSVESSLSRLGLDAVDTLLLHDPDEHDLEQSLRTALPAMRALTAEGVAQRIGVGARTLAGLIHVAKHHDVDVLMLGGRYTLLEREAEDVLLPLCLERGIAVIAAAPFNSGILASEQPDELSRYEYAGVPEDVLHQAVRLANNCLNLGVALPAAALQFPLQHAAVASVVFGADSSAQVRRNIALARSPLGASVWPALAPAR
ncbi:aldo/keto reductase [Pseudactinotalea suaedae]|uniref:aldo/keto reductase n=1 Tax=Pseudactinotalea suaedae TaxID=1524924 RepID=UPI0012E12FF7|nr:aldo/keto reductase [Pseudactinotalea suaedae]